MTEDDRQPIPYSPPSRNPEGPRLSWGREDAEDFTVDAHPLYIHEKIHPKSFIDSLTRTPADRREVQFLFRDAYNNLPTSAAYEWYQHRGNWQNRLIRGDSRRVMASLARREGLAGRVQMVFYDPPYGISFQSNFQPSTRSRSVKEGAKDIPGDPGMVQAFRDTYRNGIHSYLDNIWRNTRLIHALLHESGSLFLQIGAANVHRLAVVLDEVFGAENRVATISFAKTGGSSSKTLPEVADYLLWYAKEKPALRFFQLYEPLNLKEKIEHMSSYAMVELADGTVRALTSDERESPESALPQGSRTFRRQRLTSLNPSTTGRSEAFRWRGRDFPCDSGRHWSVSHLGLERLATRNRLVATGDRLSWKWYADEIPGRPITNLWHIQMPPNDLHYVVETAESVLERCILMATAPGDLVLDITCGSGTTALVAERWGRRWITCDAAGVPIALARQRLATAIHPYYLLRDSPEGEVEEKRLREAEPSLSLSKSEPSTSGLAPSYRHDPALGFVYERVPSVSAASMAYDKPRDPTLLVNQPLRKRGVLRVSSPFTVESESPYRYLPAGSDGLTAQRLDSDAVTAVRDALVSAGVVVPGQRQRLRLSDLEAWSGGRLVTHLATQASSGERQGARVAVAILPDDITASGTLVTRAANEAVQIGDGDVTTLLVIAFGFETGTGAGLEQRGRLQVLRAQANRDLTIGNLKDSQHDHAFVLVGEPDVQVVAAPRPAGYWTCEVLGFDVFDPTTGNLRAGKPEDISCWMLDTDYDGQSFFAHRMHFPGGEQDRQIRRMLKRLESRVDPHAQEAMFSLTSTPFPTPASGQICVRIVTHTQAEMATVVEVPGDAGAPT